MSLKTSQQVEYAKKDSLLLTRLWTGFNLSDFICCIEIGQVRSLEVLELMNNQIQFLPDELSKCSKLRMLFVDGNLIQKLPRDLLKLSSLKDLSLSRNSFTHLPRGRLPLSFQ